MAAGPATYIAPDMSAITSWQLLKSLVTTAEIAVVGGKLSQNIRDVSFSDPGTLQFLDVSAFSAIEVGLWGVADDNESATVQLYGWMENGPGRHIGTVTPIFSTTAASPATTGFHAQVGKTHKSITDAFVAATAYQNADQIAETADYDGGIIVPASQENDTPCTFIASFANTQYKWFGLAVTSLTTTGTVTSVAAIFRPIGLKSRNQSIDGT